MDPTATTAPTCPNCGADLGQPQGDIYVCTHCGHRSAPPRPVLDQAAQDERVARAIARHDASRRGQARREAAEREGASGASRGEEDAFSSDAGAAVVGIAFGASFLLVGILVLGFGLYPLFDKPNPNGPGDAGPLLLVSAALLLVGGFFFYIGLRQRRAIQLARRLRARGLHGLATFASLASMGRLVLRIEIPGRAPWKVQALDMRSGGDAVVPGQQLPVFVDPADPRKVVIDWLTVSAMIEHPLDIERE